MPDTKVYMNLGIPSSIDRNKDFPFDGIGLMRIEFLISFKIGVHPVELMKRDQEEEYVNGLVEGIEKVAAEVEPRPVVVRFSDFKTNEYRNLEGGDSWEPEESNPMLGWRGASRYISKKHDFEDIFRLECRAIKKMREDFKNVWVMVPFVRTLWEAKEVLKIMEEEGLESGDDFNIWLMVEVPSMVLELEKFNELPIDGYSIGSNDLTQNILGVGRDNQILADRDNFEADKPYFNEREPAIKRAMEMIVRKAKDENKTVSICGESASNYPEIVEYLVDLGIDSISVSPDAVEESKELVKKFEQS